MISDQIKDAFFEAVRLSARARREFLDRVGAADPRLRDRVEALLRAHETAGAFMAEPTGCAGKQSDENSLPGSNPS